MRRTAFRLLAAISLIAAAHGATRPHYGGTLRVEMTARVASPDPAVVDNLSGLLFDTLVTFSESAQAQPALAISWRHDADFKRWEFRLRPGVKFHDGTSLTVALAAASLERLGAAAQGETLVFRSEQPAPKLLYTLANSSIFKRTADGSMVGTGPFRITSWEPSRRAGLAANEDYWAGRPYLDSVEIEMGRTLRDQVQDFDLNKADVIEIGFSDTRRTLQNGKRVWTSLPVALLGITFTPSTDERMRQAVALSIDRSTIHNVLLQKQGVPAGGILPQWLSGYAFLFPVARDLERARQLGSGLGPATLAYDPADMTARLIAERIAVNARDAGLVIRPVAAGTQSSGAEIFRRRVASPDLSQALGVQIGSLPESAYTVERTLLEDHRIIPLFHLPEIYGLGSRVRGWAPSRWGGWNLESVWLAP